ncbi:MAG: hypothetical protein ACRDPK_19365 [Carbonactinosporaceae bacterium]
MDALHALPLDQLDRQHCELLPSREALSLVNVQNITAINVAVALNILSPGAEAEAEANQIVAGIQK